MSTTATKTKKSTKASKAKKETPLMSQYNGIKTKYPDAILLFRVGDFYETFGQDAIKAANVLGIVLTKRANGSASHIELAGFPHHSLDTYLPKLVKAGYRVAICDQLEDPKLTKKIVKRGVTELITPGVAINDKILDHKTNNFLATVYFGKTQMGVAFLDISTGEFLVAEGGQEYIDKLLQGFSPSEVLYSKPDQNKFRECFGDRFYTYAIEDWVFTADYANEKLLNHFKTASLKGYGIEDLEAAKIAAGAALFYLGETEHAKLGHITAVTRIAEDKYVWLDRFTIRNLEIFGSNYADGESLVGVLDSTISPMGARLLRKWLVLPLKEKIPIEERLSIVSEMVKDAGLREGVIQQMKLIGDLERMVAKISVQKINPREVRQLLRALDAIIPIKEQLVLSGHAALRLFGEQLHNCDAIRQLIVQTLTEEPPTLINKGGAIRSGVHQELDELRDIRVNGKDRLAEIQQREAEKTGITSLKIGFNNVFGYYLEVTHAHKSRVPAEWNRKQTLTNAERYITPELKEWEEKILGAQEKILALEGQLFEKLVFQLAEYVKPVQLNGQLIAKLDCLVAFATNALKFNYTLPEINDGLAIDIKDGRHPVIERQLPIGTEYIANDVYLDCEEQQVLMITGPNMSGKSAVLRQTALITLMAQIGSFVPAQSAKIGIVDKIFTRVGASDNISSGESTFMVEMNETASIVNNLSPRSLILLDEIGRGTSTYDGISIAWSLAEYLHNNGYSQPKTLFATHYHELNDLEERLPRIKNFNISTKEVGNKVIFLRKLVAGGSRHSFGIHVARMAGMPKEMLDRANEIMHYLEQNRSGADIQASLAKIPTQEFQLSLFESDDPGYRQVKESLLGLDVNTLTPIEALMKLNELKGMMEKPNN